MGAGPSQQTKDLPNDEATDILIAGGGIVGLTLALALRQQFGDAFLRIEIYEKAPHVQAEAGAGLGMYPNGLRVLRDISPTLLQRIRAVGQTYHKRYWERHDGTMLQVEADERVLLPADGDDSLEPLGIRRSQLQTTLYEYAVEQGLTVNFGKSLAGAVELKDHWVQVTFADGTTRHTRILFGADGALGVSRQLVMDEPPPLKYTGVTCLMGLSRVTTDGIYFPSSNADDFHAVLFPTGDHESCFQFHVPVPPDKANQLNWGNLSQGVGRVECAKIVEDLERQGWHEKYIRPLRAAHLIQAVRVGFCLLERPLEKWVKGRIALVGDAAHPPVPYVGQGAQQGLEDAGVVASLLKIYCTHPGDGSFDPTHFTKAMQLYQDIRQKRSTQIQEFSESLGRMQASRSRSAHDQERIMADHVLKGEVLMYGTLPIMLPGAEHDYKEDVQQATEDLHLPEISKEATLEALEQLLGFVPPNHQSTSSNPQSDEISSRVKEKRMDFHLPEEYSLKEERVRDLADWLTEGLKVHLKRIVAHNEAMAAAPVVSHEIVTSKGETILEDVSQILQVRDHIHRSDSGVSSTAEVDPNWVRLSPDVVRQLRQYIEAVADLYHDDNPFHSFEHACNVTVAVSKFLTRMTIDPDATLTLNGCDYGLVSDPLTQFGLVLAALLHDAGHEGVPPAVHRDESPKHASFETALSMLLENNEYEALRDTILGGPSELEGSDNFGCSQAERQERFHQLLVDCIGTTHTFEEQVKERRFDTGENKTNPDSQTEGSSENSEGTVAIQALIQASDVLHTMQPWHVYREWNERLFAEHYKAYKEGRTEVDPSGIWFKAEIGFLDNYILPLAKRLQDTGVFGSLGNECWALAKANRLAWRLKGPSAVNEMIRKVALEQAMANWH